MKNQFLNQLLEKLNTDKEFLNEFLQKETTDEMYEFASNAISGYTKEEFLEMLELLKNLHNKNAELSDENLDNVVGGGFVGVLASGLFGFLSGGGGVLLKKAGAKLNEKERLKKYEQYKKDHSLTDDDIVAMIASDKAAQSEAAYKQSLIEEFKKSL